MAKGKGKKLLIGGLVVGALYAAYRMFFAKPASTTSSGSTGGSNQSSGSPPAGQATSTSSGSTSPSAGTDPSNQGAGNDTDQPVGSSAAGSSPTDATTNLELAPLYDPNGSGALLGYINAQDPSDTNLYDDSGNVIGTVTPDMLPSTNPADYAPGGADAPDDQPTQDDSSGSDDGSGSDDSLDYSQGQ